MNRRILAAAAALAATATLVAGCATPQEAQSAAARTDPKGTLVKALTALSQGKDLAVTTRLDTTAADIQKIADLSGDGAQVDAKVADLLAGSAVTVAVHSTEATLATQKDATNLDAAVQFAYKGHTDTVVFTGKDKKVYVTADLTQLGKDTGLFDTDSAFDPANGAPAWVANLIGGAPTAFTLPASALNRVDQTADPATAKAVRAALLDNATFAYVGAKSGGDEIAVAVKMKPFLAAVANAAPTAGLNVDQDLKQFRDDATLTVNTVVKDGRLASVTVDLAQVKGWADGNVLDAAKAATWKKFMALNYRASLDITFSTSPAVTVPTGAYQVGQDELDAMFGGFLG